jgi:hypothetical protein
MLILTSTVTYSQKDFSYGHIEKYKRDSTVHYLHVKVVDNILNLEKVVTLVDLKGNIITKIMTRESYKIDDSETKEIKSKLAELLRKSDINDNSKAGKKKILLGDSKEEQVKLNSKSNLTVIDGQVYYIENIMNFDLDSMTESEKNEYMKKENTIKYISKIVQEMYYKKSRKYKELFY